MPISAKHVAGLARPAFHLLVLALLIVGGVFAVKTARERARLQHSYDRLRQIAGDLEIADPSQVHVMALETGEPLHFAWRVYLPANYALHVKDATGGLSLSGNSAPVDFIARMRLREEGPDELKAYIRIGGSSTRSTFGDATLAKFLRAHGREIQVDQLGGDAPAVLKPDKEVVLLRLTIPERLRAEAKETLSPHAQSFLSELYKLEFGPEPPRP